MHAAFSEPGKIRSGRRWSLNLIILGLSYHGVGSVKLPSLGILNRLLKRSKVLSLSTFVGCASSLKSLTRSVIRS